MNNYEMKIEANLPDAPKALGDWVNHEINNVIATVEFMRRLQDELDKTDLKVENIKFIEDKTRFEPFIIFELSNNLVILFYNSSALNGNEIKIQIRENTSDTNTYTPWLYETAVDYPYNDIWNLQYRRTVTLIPSKYKRDVDTVISVINKVIENNSVENIEM